MQHVVNVHDAKTNLSKLLAECEQGATIIIARNGLPVAKLVPVAEVPQFGLYKGIIPPLDITAFAPLSDDEMTTLGFDELAP